MIPFVEQKHPDYERVRAILTDSETSGTWSNFGPVAARLESHVAELVDLPPDRCVVACASGTVALHALVHLHEHLVGRALRWVVSAFTFHAQRQGPLATAIALDCGANGYLDAGALESLPTDSYDGIVVTNLFGSALDVERYEAIAQRTGKVLLFDSATCVGSRRRGTPFGRHGLGEIFSFHHTKPCGFGEGGCAILPSELADTFRSLLNFGLYMGIDTGARSLNGKMSDVAAAFVLDRLTQVDRIRTTHQEQFARIAAVAVAAGAEVLVDPTVEGGLPTLVPVLFPRPVSAERLAGAPLVLHKYYRPVATTRRASDLYARIVCFPCHGAVAALSEEALETAMSSLAG